jgi:hypothetical protein
MPFKRTPLLATEQYSTALAEGGPDLRTAWWQERQCPLRSFATEMDARAMSPLVSPRHTEVARVIQHYHMRQLGHRLLKQLETLSREFLFPTCR